MFSWVGYKRISSQFESQSVINFHGYRTITEFLEMRAYEDKFIGFVDILGFKELVLSSEKGSNITAEYLLEACELLGSSNDVKEIKRSGLSICPEAGLISNDLGFQVTRFSDSILVTTEISPAGVITLIEYCWRSIFRLMRKGLMCRGYILRGNIFHEGNEFIGPGFIKAIDSEKSVSAFRHHVYEKGTPFVEIDQSITNYVNDQDDACIKTMFERLVLTKDECCALFPFKRISHSFSVGGDFSPEKEKENNNIVRGWILMMKNELSKYVDSSNIKAVKKFEHYEEALNNQLKMCDDTDRAIDNLCQPYPSRFIRIDNIDS